jgi:O-acetyl-ADP-ribose deacetylase
LTKSTLSDKVNCDPLKAKNDAKTLLPLTLTLSLQGRGQAIHSSSKAGSTLAHFDKKERKIMKAAIHQSALEIVQGDITQQEIAAIGNAANSALAGGGGVDGAIHRAGGPTLMSELKSKYKECPTGSAVITSGGNLKAKYVIHAVGPRYSGSSRDAELLSGAYRKSLELCTQNKIDSIAFPSISTGIYGYPVEEASRIALKTVADYLKEHPEIKLVRFVLFDSRTFEVYKEALQELSQLKK